jgi:hypothetical protein
MTFFFFFLAGLAVGGIIAVALHSSGTSLDSYD